jgi:outer membrane PBP1 activator LpoA protein
VALLLPHTGPLAPTGHAVALGFTLEHSGVDVTRYDTAGTPEGALDAYKRAVNNGANWVVGPLSQKSVQALAASRYGDVSQLALNELPDRGRVRYGFYQFGLGPRASARAVAQLAAGDGRHHAAILYTNTDWGARAARAFDTAFRNTGGVVVDSRPFPFHGDHLGAAVKDLLRGGRAGVLWRDKTAGKRQQAVDMILLIADPRDARLLNPLLAFYHAAKLPVYATSEVFSGRRKPSRDRDLNGIIFCTMPFLLYPQGRYASLRSAALARAPNVLHALPRLVALGADAASLMGRLGGLTGAAGARFAGATGRLGLSLGGRVMRHLPCAQFNNGEPVPLAPP